MHRVLLLVCGMLIPVLAQGATYYVAPTGNDTHTCAAAQNIGTPKRTIAAGLRCPGPGDTLALRAGTYTESVIDGFPGGTSWNAPVTIRGIPGDPKPVWRPVGQEYIFYMAQPSEHYITFQDLIFDAQGPQQGGGMPKITGNPGPVGAHHIRFVNCIWRNGVRQEDGGGPNSCCMQWSHTHHNEILGGIVESGQYTLYIAAEASENLIDGLTSVTTTGYGIHCYDPNQGSHNNVIRNSTIANAGTSRTQCGILLSCGSGNQAINNIVSGGSGGGICVGHAAGASNTSVYNNTITGNHAGSGFYGLYIASGSGHSVKNNIAWNNGGRGDYSVTGASESHNLIGTDPRFVNAATGDFHLQAGSPGIDAGVAISQVVTARDGAPRPQGAGYDIGAYEYGNSHRPVLPPPRNLRRVTP